MKEEIIKLKKAKKAIILAHNYQDPHIQDIADFVGDSLELAKKVVDIDCKIIVMCGVKFMAQMCKILSPDKKVLIPAEDASCPLAESITVQKLKELKEKHPGAEVVSYVNTTAEIKSLSDYCCTSANACWVVERIPCKEVIFVPDKNLGWWVSFKIPNKKVILCDGFCYVHQMFNVEEIDTARKLHPQAKILVHPECEPQVLREADEVLSTSQMLSYVRNSNVEEFVIGTEEGLLYRLSKENPHKRFFSLGKRKICRDMKKINLENLYLSLKEERYEVILPQEIINTARKSIERMFSLKYEK